MENPVESRLVFFPDDSEVGIFICALLLTGFDKNRYVSLMTQVTVG